MEARGKGLLSVFADAFWRDYMGNPVLLERFVSPVVSNKERMRLLANCSQIILYLKGDLPISNDIIEALVWAVSRYGHEELNIEPRIDLQSHLLQCARTEPELHVLKEYYRDHFFHCLEVCFLGQFLLELHIKGQPLWSRVAAILGLREKFEVLKLWYLAALLHDIGYLLDALKATNEALEFFKNSGAVKRFTDDVKKALDALSERIDDEMFCDYAAKDKPGEDHGVISALHLEALLKSIADDKDKVKMEYYQPAIRAIATHNSRKHTISFAKEPLGFLLILCDTIQEWVRPRLIYSTAPVQMLTWLMGRSSETKELLGPFRKLIIHNIVRDGPNYKLLPLNGELRLCCTMEYGDGINKNSGVFNLWLDASCNLQRLDMNELGFKIDVEYITPCYQLKPGAVFEQQLHRLQHAVRETHMGFMDRWFPRWPRQYQTGDGQTHVDCVTNGAVSYFIEPRGHRKYEHLILNLHQLSGKNLISKKIDDFREDLKNWKHYNNDRIFAGDYAPSVPS